MQIKIPAEKLGIIRLYFDGTLVKSFESVSAFNKYMRSQPIVKFDIVEMTIKPDVRYDLLPFEF